MAFQNKNGKPVLLAMVKAVQANKDYLSEVDGLIGDGDHGMNMNKGFSVFGERIAASDVSFTEGLEELSSVLMDEIGGSMGPIYGTIFMEMADAGDAYDEIGPNQLAEMMAAGMEALEDIVDARVGDKTLVDTFAPAVRALEDATGDMASALEAMKAAAREGRDSTKDLVAKYGRSARLGERSRGVLDAGATSCCIILEAMADAIIEQL